MAISPVAILSAGSWPGRHLAASRSSACYRNRWDHRDHRDRACLALRTRNRLAGFARANGLVRQHCLFTGHLLGAAAWLAISRRSRWSRGARPAHQKMKSLRAARRLEGGCPSHCLRAKPDWDSRHLGGGPMARQALGRFALWSRSAHQKMKSLAGGPATGPPSASPLAPRASGFAVRASVRAPLARHWPAFGPCRGTKGFYPGKRPGKRPARRPQNFFHFFSQTLLRTLGQCDTLAAVQRPE